MRVDQRRWFDSRFAAAAVLMSLTLDSCMMLSSYKPEADPAPTLYLEQAGPTASFVPVSQIIVGGQHVSCGAAPVVLDPGLNDYAMAFSRFIVLNPVLMPKQPEPVQLWIFYHECGHVVHGPGEAEADCYSVKRGKREHWLSMSRLETVCDFIRPGQQDSVHFSGAQRCEDMRACFADVSK